ncbi:hypothetical protein RFI_09022 [Reticulomyxa filosa]|uniref:Uncharacterized protein n=1 Tax=Reticulomyxa filosa TaxID=46433 RepID=X6NPA1_RETFI|nr:hypothetical protein RFI_09022 [Reticulomyxa filosa]|eukprot:ETO28110.1 hypothetical protein RFI_09022 [Reticulomyxa filosa]
MAKSDGSEKEYKMVVMGGGGVGKSALTIRLISGNFLDEYDPTVWEGKGQGKKFLRNQNLFILMRSFFRDIKTKQKKKIEDSYRKTVQIDGVPATLDILDTAGQDEFAAMRDLWIREAKGFLLVYAITWTSSFNQVQEMFQKIHRIKEEELNEIAIVLVGSFFFWFTKRTQTKKKGNKCDLAESRTVSMEQGQNLVQQWKKEGVSAAFFEASAKAQINNEECYFEIVRQLRKKEQTLDTEVVGDGKKTQTCNCTMLYVWVKLLFKENLVEFDAFFCYMRVFFSFVLLVPSLLDETRGVVKNLVTLIPPKALTFLHVRGCSFFVVCFV